MANESKPEDAKKRGSGALIKAIVIVSVLVVVEMVGAAMLIPSAEETEARARELALANRGEESLGEEGETAIIAAAAETRENVLALSAWTGEGIEALVAEITPRITPDRHHAELSLEPSEGRKRAWLFDKGLVEGETQGEDGYHLTIRWNAQQEAQFNAI